MEIMVIESCADIRESRGSALYRVTGKQRE